MKNFSLVKNDSEQFPELPRGLVVVFGYKKNAVAYMDYDGKADRPTPETVTDEWFPLSQDQDSVMAWHGERQKVSNREQVKITWRKPRR